MSAAPADTCPHLAALPATWQAAIKASVDSAPPLSQAARDQLARLLPPAPLRPDPAQPASRRTAS